VISPSAITTRSSPIAVRAGSSPRRPRARRHPPGEHAEDGSWPVEIERLGAAWPDPALPPLADGMTASEAREQVNGYLTAALNITQPVGIVVIAADWRYRLTGGYNRTWLRVDTSRNKESSHDR
jgi:hypothetical protein